MASSGFSTTRLQRLYEVMTGYVERGEIARLVTVLARRGEAPIDAIGVRDLASGAPMGQDTIFRIASMTKPVTAAATMILIEEARLRLDDPIDPWLPELADRRVLRTITSPLGDTDPAHRPISARDLLTMRMGIGAIMEAPGAARLPKHSTAISGAWPTPRSTTDPRLAVRRVVYPTRWSMPWPPSFPAKP